MRLKLLLGALVFCWLGSFASTGRAHPATGIVVDHKGNVYFSDLETIWKLDQNNELSVFRAGVSGRHVHELAIDGQDNIYGADYSYEAPKFITAIWKMTTDGVFQYLLTPTDNPPPGMSIWRDQEGNNYLVEQDNHTQKQTLLLRRAVDGKLTVLAGDKFGHADGKGAAAKFGVVGGLAFGPDGSLFVTEVGSVRKVTMDGTVTTVASNLGGRTAANKSTALEGAFHNLTGLSVDAKGNIYAADPENRRLLKIDFAGKSEILLRTDPPFFPNGVIASPSGDVYVLEVGFTPPRTSSGPRVRKIGADGHQAVLAVIGETKVKTSSRSNAAGSATFIKTEIKTQPIKLVVIGLGVVLLGTLAIMWNRRRRQQT